MSFGLCCVRGGSSVAYGCWILLLLSGGRKEGVREEGGRREGGRGAVVVVDGGGEREK